MRRLWRLVVATVLALATAIFIASPAMAVPPQQETFHDEFSFDIDCGTFLLHEDVVVDVRVTTFFDESGDPTAIQEHVHFVGVITNPAGETFRDPGFFTNFVDLAGTPDNPDDDVIAQAGLIFNITIPGQGSVAQDTGVIIFLLATGEVIIHGPHEVFQQGDALICEALG